MPIEKINFPSFDANKFLAKQIERKKPAEKTDFAAILEENLKKTVVHTHPSVFIKQ